VNPSSKRCSNHDATQMNRDALVTPTDEQKRERLLAHQRKVEAHDPQCWFFIPGEDGQVRGYLGTDEIAIVGKRPSTATHFSGESARLFYQILFKYGLSNAHVTDAIKTGGKATDPDPGQKAMEEHRRLFLEEIAILRLKAIIVMGHPGSSLRTFEIMQSYGCGLPLYPIRHYSWMRWNKMNRIAWERELRSTLTLIYPDRIYPDIEECGETAAGSRGGTLPVPKVIYDAADLRFVCGLIEPLEPGDHFRIRTRKFGPVQMSKAEFYALFANVVKPGSCYWTAGYYKYSSVPIRARHLLIV